MFRVWTSDDDDIDRLARELEAHLNEFADEVLSVSYAVDGVHRVLAVYRAVELTAESAEAVAQAEEIVEGA